MLQCLLQLMQKAVEARRESCTGLLWQVHDAAVHCKHKVHHVLLWLPIQCVQVQ